MSIGEHRLSLPAGYTLGKYLFRELLGSGGFGITYLAEDRSLNRRVAIKELLPNDIATRIDGTTVAAKTKGDEGSLEWARERFVNEGRALAACEHPNIVHVYEMLEANGTAYMVTKYEEGCSFEKWLGGLGRPPDESELRGILMPLLAGLEKVHETGFLHRDIKPDNIYITTPGRPLLLDFGSARQAVSNRSMAMTSIVSSGYAPFEQYYEDGNQGPWSDLYALGAVVYRAITGKKPPEATRRQKEDSCGKLVEQFAGKYSPAFLRAIDRALAVNEADRPQNIAGWRAMLAGQEMDAPTVVQKNPPHSPPVVADKNKRRPSIGVMAYAALVAVAAGLWFFSRSHPGSAAPASGPEKIASPPLAPVSGPVPASPVPVRDDLSQKTIDSDKLALSQPVVPTQDVNGTTEPAASPAAVVAEIDPHLVGAWQTGATRAKREHWQLWTNGYWQMWGPVNDSGTFTGGAGKIRQYSNNTGQWTDGMYELENETLVTHNPEGAITWRHPPAATSDSEGAPPRRRSSQDSPVKSFFSHLFHGHSK